MVHIGSSDHLNLLSFQPLLHNWCNKGHGICYHVCGMVHIKNPLLLITRSSQVVTAAVFFSLHITVSKIC